MRILIVGAHGFIGRRLAEVLRAADHRVIGAVRAPRNADELRADLASIDEAQWLALLAGVDVVINAAGIVRETRDACFAAVHSAGPQALFRACAAASVRRVIQISALGADENAASRFHLSKREADQALLQSPIDGVVVQPSLVFGADGASAQWFLRLASLPLIPLPGRGSQLIQPIHIDDLCAAVAALLRPGLGRRSRIPLVGPRALTLRDYLAQLRRALGLGRPCFLPVPLPLVKLAAPVLRGLGSGLLTPETLAMLLRGNTADAQATRYLLEREPRPATEFLTGSNLADVRLRGQLGWLLPLLRSSIAAVWIVSGLLSLGIYPVEQSHQLLARTGVPAALIPAALNTAAVLNLMLGFSVLLLRRRRTLWLAQTTVILAYTAVITVKLPEFWLHPYGPILKNLPMLAAIWLLYELERDDGISDR